MTIIIAPSTTSGDLARFTAYSSAGGEVEGKMVIGDSAHPIFKPNDEAAFKRLKEVDAKYNGRAR